MSTNDYIKYITEVFIKHFEIPKTERKEMRRQKKEMRPPALFNWFGLLPYSLRLFIKRKS